MLVKSLCPYCGCGCSILLEVKRGRVVGVKPDKADPVSKGRPCIKGLSAYQMVYAPDRIKTPLIRKNKKSKKLTSVGWETAYRFIKKNIKKLKLKPEQIAFYASPPASNEDAYLFQRFAGDVFGTRNIDSCSRLCHASTCYALQETLGITAMPSLIEDFSNADCILITGSNPAATYPVAFDKILKAKKKGAKLICVRDWQDQTARHADLYVEILDGTQLPFLNCILNELIKRKAVRVEIPNEFKKHLRKYTKSKVAGICKTSKEKIQRVVNMVARSKRFVLCYGMGLTQHTCGVNNVRAALNLVLAKKGKIISMRGKANIQGVADMGCMPRFNGQTFTSSIFVRPVKALWIMESNPAQSMPDLNLTHQLLKKMFVVLHTTYPNLTMQFADVVLPCCSWAERDGVYTNAESRVRYFNKAIEHMWATKPNWKIICEAAKHFGKEYPYKNVFEIVEEIKNRVRGYSHIDIKKLKSGKSQFVNRPIRFEKFHPAEFKGVEEKTTKKFPFVLTTERLPFDFCTGEQSSRTPDLKKLSHGPRAFVSVEDAKTLRLKNGDKIKVTSYVGSLKTPVQVLDEVPKGLISIPFHFEKLLVNKLVPLEFDPFVEEPNLKKIAVRIRKIR